MKLYTVMYLTYLRKLAACVMVPVLLALIVVGCGQTQVQSESTTATPEVPGTTTTTATITTTTTATITATTTTTVTATAPPQLTPDPTIEAANFETESAVTYNENMGGGGGKNIVKVLNRQDGRFVIRGNIQLNRIPAPNVEPWNLAWAQSSCTDCQTMAVALQINLYERGAPRVAPQNAAIAVNIACTRCVTVARALQYTIPVDDIREVPRDVNELIREMDRELNDIRRTATSVAEAEPRVNQVIERFRQLAQYLNDARDEDTGNVTPTPSVTGTVTVVPSPSVEATSTVIVTATVVSTPTTAQPTTTATMQSTPTANAQSTTTAMPTGTRPSSGASPTPTPTNTAIPTHIPTPGPTATP